MYDVSTTLSKRSVLSSLAGLTV